MEQLIDLLKIEGFSRHILLALLKATPVAMRGEATLLPRIDVMEIAQNDYETLEAVLRDLLVPRKLTLGEQWFVFSPLQSVVWVDDGAFLSYQVTPMFITLIGQFNAEDE